MIELLGWALFVLAALMILILIGGVIYMIHDMFRQNRRGRM